jgi:sphingomyelin phosphodiesterase
MNRILVVWCVVAAVASVRISQERLQDLEVRLGDIKNQLHDDNETRSERMKEIYSEIAVSEIRGVQSPFVCGLCYVVINNLFWMRRVQKRSDEYLTNLAMKMCVDLEIQSEEVCHGVIEYNAPSIIYIVDKRPELTADTVCKLLLNDGVCVFPTFDRTLDFSVKISERKPSNQSRETFEIGNNLTIIHFTDIHYDSKYQQGAFADCEEHACCREVDDVNEIDLSSNAGRWGDYRSCDSPLSAIRDAFHQIRKQHSVNLIRKPF